MTVHVPKPETIAAVMPTEGVDREIVRGINAAAVAHGWLMHVIYPPPETTLEAMARSLVSVDPQVVVVSSRSGTLPREVLRNRIVVGANTRLTGPGQHSVVIDEAAAGRRAATYLLGLGLPNFAVYGLGPAGFAVERADAFRAEVERAGRRFVGWGTSGELTVAATGDEFGGGVEPWLAPAPKPIGVLAGCDSWGRMLGAACRSIGLRVPDEVAIVGVDNDELVCELAHPPLSSVMIPWQRLGSEAMRIGILRAQGEPAPTTVTIEPGEVVARHSSDMLSVDDDLVAAALRLIRANVGKIREVPDILRRVPASRRDLERRFRRTLGRSIMEEVRAVRVDHAKRLLSMTDLKLHEIADRTGFANRTKLSVAFKVETGTSPAVYRRKFRTTGTG
jgi:LacI family transcriptional regulator